MIDVDSDDGKQYIADAKKARSLPVYVCFEEPSDPLVWTAKDPNDKGWGGSADRPGTTSYGYPKEYPASHCKDHIELGCGWYWLIPEGIFTRQYLEKVILEGEKDGV